MSKVQTLRAFVKQRLSLAAEEIFELFERTIAEYEEQLCRQNKLLDAVFKPQLQLHRADVQLLLVSKEDEWSSRLDQEDPSDLPHVKEEQEEFWTNSKGEPEEADIIKSTFTPVPVKSEDDEEKPRSIQFNQRQIEEIKSEVDGEDCGGLEPARNFRPGRHLQPDTDDKTSDCSELGTDDSDGWKRNRKPQSGLNFLRIGSRHKTGEKSLSCSECGKRFSCKSELQRHVRIHSGEKPYCCTVCSKRFTQKIHLTRHTAVHTGEKRYSCRDCGKRLTFFYQLINHQWVGCQSSQLHRGQTEENRDAEHLETEADGENCARPEPDRSFNPGRHSHPDTEEKTSDFSEPKSIDCEEWRESRKPQSGLNRKHKTGEKWLSCSDCSKRFSCSSELQRHVRIHSGERPYGCSVCSKRFTQKIHLTRHTALHTREKPFSCPVCSKRYTQKVTLRHHMAVHTGEKPYSCNICGQGFTWLSQFKRHQRVGCLNSQLYQSQSGETRDAEYLISEADEEECGGPEPARNCNPECDRSFGHKENQQSEIQVELESFSCSV